MPELGLVLLVLVGIGILFTGLPAAFVLIGVATLGGLFSAAAGIVPLSLLSALPGRLVNLLENDLLQALPLYVFMGLLLDRLPVAEALYRTCLAILPRGLSGQLMSGTLLGALLGPMNGSVGASVLALSRVVAPRLERHGVPEPTLAALVAVASTLGVVIPPSLVLILLGDAMLGAHTIAVTTTGRNDRVINTQDIFHGALVPAGLFLALCLIAAWLAGRSLPTTDRAPETRPTRNEVLLTIVTVTFLIGLLGGVAFGFFYAVEAAALGAFVLFTGGLLSGRLSGGALRDVLTRAMAMTGALFALLIAATTLTLMLRILGTDKLVAGWVAALPGNDLAVVAIVLFAIGLCAFVLDAFEIIFVIVPIVVPPLLIRVDDARWVAVLLLLSLQTSFLLPPAGYALMMVRGTLRYAGSLAALMRALFPFLVAQWLVLATVLLVPQLAHVGEKDVKRETPNLTADEINRRMQDMLTPLPELEPLK